jgi:hypothetical protein
MPIWRSNVMQAPRVLNQRFNELRPERHPDKRVSRRIEKGFDFLGYHPSSEGLGMAAKTIEAFVARAVRLCEQEPGEPLASLPAWIVCEAVDEVAKCNLLHIERCLGSFIRRRI